MAVEDLIVTKAGPSTVRVYMSAMHPCIIKSKIKQKYNMPGTFYKDFTEILFEE